MTPAATPPLPTEDALTAPFWAGLRERRLLLQRCAACGHVVFPVSPACPECLGAELAWTPMSGLGRVASFAIYHHVFHPWFADKVPYNVALVALREGPRLITNIVGIDDDALRSGLDVEAVFDPVDERHVLLRFRPR